MSLINDMLRDLSQQHSSNAQDSLLLNDVQTATWEREKIAHFFQYSRMPLALVSVLVFLIGYGITQYVFKHDGLSFQIDESGVALSSSNPSVDGSQQVENQDAPIQQRSAVPTDKIYLLIDQASRAMTLDRLTSPENDNAYFYYQELLKLDANNAIAIAGLKKITDRYLQMADKFIQKNNLSKANIYLDKAESVTPGDTRIANLRQSTVVIDTQEIPLPVEEPALNTEAVQSTPVSDPFEKPSKEPSISVTANVEHLDQQMVQQSRELIAQGFKSRALRLLENHVQANPAPKSETFLLDVYYQDKNIAAMERVLALPLAQSIVEQHYYSARLAVLKNDNPSAIQFLELQLSEAASNENYRALLAGLYQREQRYLEAVSAYRNLLQSFQPKPAYWLGLALSLDAQGQEPAAMQAYTQLLNFEQLEPQVRVYAQERIAELSQ